MSQLRASGSFFSFVVVLPSRSVSVSTRRFFCIRFPLAVRSIHWKISINSSKIIRVFRNLSTKEDSSVRQFSLVANVFLLIGIKGKTMGNGGCEMRGWNLLPDNLLLSIFQYLQRKDLVIVSEVCWHWAKVSKDNFLWKRRLCIDYKINPRTSISSFNVDGMWISEYRRIVDEFPIVESEVLTSHDDEVLYVAFSNDGSMFSTCSKDCTLKIWQTGHPCRLLQSKNLREAFNWRYTQMSRFNADDSLILVSGVHIGHNTTSGEIAVFELKDGELEFRSRVLNKPYDVFGCWYDEDHVINGELHWISHLTSTSDIFLCAASQEVESEQKPVMARLFKFLNRNASTVHMITISSHVSSWLRYAIEMTEKLVAAEKAGVELQLNMDELSFDNWETSDDGGGAGTSGGSTADKLLIFGSGSLTYAPHQVCFKLLRGRTVDELINADVMTPEKRQAVMDRIRQQREAMDQARAAAAQQNLDYNDEEEEEAVGMNAQEEDEDAGGGDVEPPEIDFNWQDIMDKFDFADHFVEMHGHITGMALTHDERYLFVNVRPWPDGCIISDPMEPPPIAQQIEVRVIDLETLALLDAKYTSHKGFTPNDECFFVFLDACDQFVASGSEDSHGYVWDRHYQCLLGKLAHTNVVNSVAFNPKDPTVLVTASDDHTIKVWRSKAYVRELNAQID